VAYERRGDFPYENCRSSERGVIGMARIGNESIVLASMAAPAVTRWRRHRRIVLL
jgi:hypothetical protein